MTRGDGLSVAVRVLDRYRAYTPWPMTSDEIRKTFI